MPDFVNPKYKNDAKTVFKKPTRLECMMQDFPTVLEAGETKRVGFTQAAAEICFSPVKNNLADGVALQDDGIAAGTAATVRVLTEQSACVAACVHAFACTVWFGTMVSPHSYIPDLGRGGSVCCHEDHASFEGVSH